MESNVKNKQEMNQKKDNEIEIQEEPNSQLGTIDTKIEKDFNWLTTWLGLGILAGLMLGFSLLFHILKCLVPLQHYKQFWQKFQGKLDRFLEQILLPLHKRLHA